MKPARKRVPVNREAWSEKSRASVDYILSGDFYEDNPFSCRACGRPGVFTAEQQKYTYEVKKAYTWEQHVLCPDCYTRSIELMTESASLLNAWLTDKAAMARNLKVIGRWREVLELLPKYGIRKDTARIRMLTRLLGNAA